MADHNALLLVFADYARTLAEPYDIGDVLYRLTDQCVEVLGVDGAGVSIVDGDRLRFVTATDQQIVHVEERQVSVGQGPCHDASNKGDVVTSEDLTTEERWSDYTPSALANGCKAVAGIPMRAGDTRVGALNLYTRDVRTWPAEDLQIARVLADMATGYILNARTLTETQRLAAQLQHALASRVIIEQAKGVLAERHAIDPAKAFDGLRAYARSRNAKVHEVARQVVDRALDL